MDHKGPWLSALALPAFLPAFGLARLFTFILTQVVVVQSGLHFHRFWYGIVLLAASGWLGIVGGDRWNRLAAIMYGLGGGLLADEVGLILRRSVRSDEKDCDERSADIALPQPEFSQL